MTLSIIIPIFNESESILANYNKLKSFLSNASYSYELIYVNDGSTDNTKDILSNIKDIKVVSYDINQGKGNAVREGILASSGDYVLFMDADFSTSLEDIHKVLEAKEDADIVIGSRHAKDSNITKKQPLKRIFVGWCCRRLTNLITHLHYTDTQCGFKFIKGDVAKKIASKARIKRFAFDVEYLYIAKINNLKVKEMGVTWQDDRDSRVKVLSSSMNFFKDLFKIKKAKKEYKF